MVVEFLNIFGTFYDIQDALQQEITYGMLLFLILHSVAVKCDYFSWGIAWRETIAKKQLFKECLIRPCTIFKATKQITYYPCITCSLNETDLN